MIIDTLNNLSFYKKTCKGISEVTAFLKERDLISLSPGRYEMGGGCYLNLGEYNTKPQNDAVFEAHRKYIDVQLIVSGKEIILWQNIGMGKVIKEYQENDDYSLFKADNYIRLNVASEMFCIFFPGDLHCPSVSDGESANVKKAVFKIPV